MPRSRNRNKNYTKGLANRQHGICKKATTSFRFYGGAIGIVMKQNGRVTTYETSPGVLEKAISEPWDSSFGPDDFETVADRQETPSTGTSDMSSDSPPRTPPRGTEISQFHPSASPNTICSLSSRSSTHSTSSSSAVPEFDMGPGLTFPDSPMPFALALPPTSPSQRSDSQASTPIQCILPSTLLPMPPVPEMENSASPPRPRSPELLGLKPMSRSRRRALLALAEEFLRG